MPQGTHVQQSRKSRTQSSKLAWCVKDAMSVLHSWEGRRFAVGGGVWAGRESFLRLVTLSHTNDNQTPPQPYHPEDSLWKRSPVDPSFIAIKRRSLAQLVLMVIESFVTCIMSILVTVCIGTEKDNPWILIKALFFKLNSTVRTRRSQDPMQSNQLLSWRHKALVWPAGWLWISRFWVGAQSTVLSGPRPHVRAWKSAKGHSGALPKRTGKTMGFVVGLNIIWWGDSTFLNSVFSSLKGM